MRIPMLSLFLAAVASAAAAQSVDGKYSVAGKNFDGSPYRGTVEITPTGSTCRIVWQTGSSTSEGLCMQSGKTFAAFYKLGTEFGLVIYDLQPDGSLAGRWSVAGKEGVGTEVLTPQR